MTEKKKTTKKAAPKIAITPKVKAKVAVKEDVYPAISVAKIIGLSDFDFLTIKNQKKIKINKEKCDNSNIDNYYAKINLKALQSAMHTLTPKAFELWIYFSKNSL